MWWVCRKGWLLWLSSVLFLASCKKELSCEDCKGSGLNTAPVADAGTNQTVRLGTTPILLNGTLSTDAENNITNYTWTKISGPSPVSIANANAVQTRVKNFVEGKYQFELKVTDAFNLSSRDTVVIKVIHQNEIIVNWTKLQSVPERDFYFGSNHINFLLGINDQLFAVSKNGSFWRYDPLKRDWVQKGELPGYATSANLSVVFSINNVGYLIGNGTSRHYNAVTGEWSTKKNPPIGPDHVDYSIPLVIGNKAYLVGSTNNLVTEYDPASDTYTKKKRFPDVDARAGFVVNGEGYCIQKDGRCWKYDPTTDSWQQKASLPPSIHNMSGFTLNGYGYVIGDLNRAAYNQNSRMKMWRYYPVSDEWKQIDEEYPGEAVYEIRTVSLKRIVYLGLGYNHKDKDVLDFWTLK